MPNLGLSSTSVFSCIYIYIEIKTLHVYVQHGMCNFTDMTLKKWVEVFDKIAFNL